MNDNSIISRFRSQYGHLKKFGLKVDGVANLIEDYDVIAVSVPFVFDQRNLPKKFMGLHVRVGTTENSLPPEFQNLDRDKEYIWAYQRFELYVDRHADTIRKTLDNPAMTREEMLDALCFGDFNKHKERCMKLEAEGVIPRW